jgi:ATP-dependent DNA helicase DinG
MSDTKPRTKRRLGDATTAPKTKRRLGTPVEGVSLVPHPRDSMFGMTPFPDWVTEFRPHQWDAVQEIVREFESGTDVVFLDAPTGSGKTLIAELVRRLLGYKALYVCSGKDLQAQFLQDFPYAHVLMGRSNYPTLDKPFPFVTCADCNKTGKGEDAECDWCNEPKRCPYQQAKNSAMSSQLAVVNTSYLLAEANWIGSFSEQDFVIADECDMLEGELMNFVKFEVSDTMLRSLNITPPKKGVHKTTIAKWIQDEFIPCLIEEHKYVERDGSLDKIEKIRRLNSLGRKLQEARVVVDEIVDDNWVRDNDAGPLVLKPVKVNGYGRENLWRHGAKWLCMSATIVSSDEMAASLGITEPYEDNGVEFEPLKYATVKVPMTFPLHHRRIIASNVGKMSQKELDATFPKMVDSLLAICSRHPDDNILVHTHSYKLNGMLADALQTSSELMRPVVTYRRGADRDTALSKFRSNPRSVLLAPSMDRGIDLAGDSCRVVVISKVPYPYLGDSQVSARLHLPGGQTWYNVQTVRTIVQMTGRAVRSKNDYATTYILDGSFMKFWSKGKSLLPDWWRESVTVVSPRQLLDGRYDLSEP